MQLLSIIKNKYLIYSTLALIISISLYSGFKFSSYNQDYHHSFFILSLYIDSQNGFEYFKDIFLQYGPGQPILFNLIDYFIQINIVSISNINVVVYSIHLIILLHIASIRGGFFVYSNLETAASYPFFKSYSFT